MFIVLKSRYFVGKYVEIGRASFGRISLERKDLREIDFSEFVSCIHNDYECNELQLIVKGSVSRGSF